MNVETSQPFEIFHVCSYSIWLQFDTKSKLVTIRSQVLHHFVCWYVKCVKKFLKIWPHISVSLQQLKLANFFNTFKHCPTHLHPVAYISLIDEGRNTLKH